MKHGSRQTQRSSLGSHQNIRISFLKLKKYIYRNYPPFTGQNIFYSLRRSVQNTIFQGKQNI